LNLLESYGGAIVRRPWAALGAIIIFTLIMGYFASQTEFSSNEEDFQPETEVALASNRVQETFGAQDRSITTLFLSEGNVLSRDHLLAQLEFQAEISKSSIISPLIVTSLSNPTGFSSPGIVITQAAFINRAVETFSGSGSPGQGQPNGEVPPFAETLSLRALNLSIDERRTILAGGVLDIEVEGLPFPVDLEFSAYEPGMLSTYLENTPYGSILSFLLSKDYDSTGGTAGDAIFSLTVYGNLSQDQYLEIERDLQSMASLVEQSQVDLEVRVIGDELVNEAITDATAESIPLLMSVAFGSVIVILIIIYRSIVDTLLNLISLVFAVVWVFGLGVILGFGFNPAITAVPVLIIGLGIDYGIHLTSRYREELRGGRSVKDALTRTEASVGFAIFLTTITTLVGFMSNIGSNVSSIQQFGILAASGIVSAFFLMVTLVPATKAILDGRKEKKGVPLVKPPRDRTGGWGFARKKVEANRPELMEEMVCSSGVACINRGLGTGALAARYPALVFIIVAIVTVAGVWGTLQLEIRFDFRDFLPSGLEVSESLNILFEDFDFSGEQVYVLIEGDISDPSVFTSLEAVGDSAKESPYAAPSDAVDSPLELARSLSDQGSFRFDPAFAEVWSKNIDRDSDGKLDSGITRSEVQAVYDALYEYAGERTAGVLHREDGVYDSMVIKVTISAVSGTDYGPVAESMREVSRPAEDLEESADVEVTVTGSPIISADILDSIGRDQVRSVLITVLVSLGILTILYLVMRRSASLGLVTITPLLFVIIWGAGSMHFTGIPLNVVTVTILAITVGLGIDYGIHVTQRFLEDLDRIGDAECALCVTADHTGSALFGSVVTTVIGFGILTLSIIPPIAQLGIVTALTIGLAFLASLFVLPTFLRLWYIWGPRRKLTREK